MAQKFDRSQFKATRVDALVEQSKNVQEITGSTNSDRAKILELQRDGSKNRLRIFPKHPGTDSWIYPRTVHFLKVTQTDKDGNPIHDERGNVKVGKKPIFNSRVHGGTAKDIIDEYINFVYAKAFDEIQDEDTRKKYLRPIEGWRSGTTYTPGIKSQTRWIIYGDLNGTFGRVELPTSVKNKLNEIAAGQDDEDGSIIVDPFTDEQDGRRVFIEYHANEKDPGKKYTAAIDLAKATPLTDEQFEALINQRPLKEIYDKVYRRKDFMMALEGLKTFDEESAEVLKQLGFSSGYEVFTYDEFLDIAEEISGYYSDDESSVEDEDHHAGDEFLAIQHPVQPSNEPPFDADEVEDLVQDSTQQLSQMDMSQLKAYIKNNGLSIRVLPSYTEDQVRLFIQEEMSMMEQEHQDEQEEQSQQSNETASRGSRLSNLKNKVTK